MNPSEYQRLAKRTLIDRPEVPLTDRETMTIWCALGLAGEAGEVADDLKKSILHRHGLKHDRLLKEVGDVCWYLAAICTLTGLDLGEAMVVNIAKLEQRYPEGFSSIASRERKG